MHVAVPLAGTGHAVPQAPQFAVSEVTFRQALPQARWPGSQVNPQLPALQTALPRSGTPHATPQAEQWPGSLEVSAHCPPQFVSPRGQATVQVPPAQTPFAPQAIPHPPQFLGSLESRTQASPQAT